MIAWFNRRRARRLRQRDPLGLVALKSILSR